MATTRNPIAEANEEAAHRLLAFHTDREAFDMGWEAALEYSRPLVKVAYQTFQVLEQMGMLDEGGRTAMKAANRFLELVPEKRQA